MPQGKGTYGSQVGRPSKKDKYQEGGNVTDPFSTKNPEGVPAEKQMEEIENQNAIPTSNAMERSETYQLGGAVKPPTAPSITAYEEGGKVKKNKDKYKYFEDAILGRTRNYFDSDVTDIVKRTFSEKEFKERGGSWKPVTDVKKKKKGKK